MRARSAVLPCLIVAYALAGTILAATSPTSGTGAAMIGVAVIWSVGLWASR